MAVTCLSSFSKIQFQGFLETIDTVITDCDEVLWSGNNMFPGSAMVINQFHKLGKQIFYLSNNNTNTRQQLVNKLENFGFYVDAERALNSAHMAGLYIKNLNLSKDEKVYVIGSVGLSEELSRFGINHFGLGPDEMKAEVITYASTVVPDPSVRAVLIGFDQHFSVPKIIKACTYLNDPSVHFVATNPDARTMRDMKILPGTGAIVNAVKTCCGREPVFVGKPEAFLCNTLVEKWKIDPEKTLMIGDTCFTDILLGTRCGFQTLLVLTGNTNLSTVMKWKTEDDKTKAGMIPDYYVSHLQDLLELMV